MMPRSAAGCALLTGLFAALYFINPKFASSWIWGVGFSAIFAIAFLLLPNSPRKSGEEV